jgi:hypothetical protein
MLGPVLEEVGRIAAARQSPGMGMWVTVECLCYLDHAGFAAKSRALRSLDGHKAARAGRDFRLPVLVVWPWPHLGLRRVL